MHKSGGDERGVMPKSIGDFHRDIDDESLLNLAGRYHEENIAQKILEKIIVPSPHARSTRTGGPLEARVQRLEQTVDDLKGAPPPLHRPSSARARSEAVAAARAV